MRPRVPNIDIDLLQNHATGLQVNKDIDLASKDLCTPEGEHRTNLCGEGHSIKIHPLSKQKNFASQKNI